MGKSVDEVMGMTLMQCAAFLTNKKSLKSSKQTVNSFAEARAMLRARKKAKDGK